ncbi:MAG: DUF234 domain-containing protein [Streptococcaceae bacterium]|jgi:AAA+ ATPase superfamily predicted ATPase|nr:DUF234 domain-containing protein [Streptococcaceae bacterium]
MFVGRKDELQTLSRLITLSDLNFWFYMEDVEKEYPYRENEATSKKGKYILADNMFRFWYRFIFPNKRRIEIGNGLYLAEKKIFLLFSTFVGKPIFEEVTIEYMIRLSHTDAFSFFPTFYGTWWGADNEYKKATDIDILIVDDEDEKVAIFGECKWRNDFQQHKEIEKLLDKPRLFLHLKPRLYFFTKTNLSDVEKKYAKEKKIEIVTLDDYFDLCLD